ncbi:hypothetical protein COCVIDRAFT_13179 [Bipolaris victoriae FI3]|uniref:Uncharacterized protein n=1 Tax=Bipolaris victoriae (strain FI3) TaxID=930091 RepID=W7ER30_BIPV3|nr:hypothetical protein COCVIDRAFT_13179 [Bipolaris victoriae FI3]
MVKRLIAVHVAFDARRLRGFVRWWTKKAKAWDSVISSPYLLCTAPTPSSSGIPVITPMPAHDDSMASTTRLHSHPPTWACQDKVGAGLGCRHGKGAIALLLAGGLLAASDWRTAQFVPGDSSTACKMMSRRPSAHCVPLDRRQPSHAGTLSYIWLGLAQQSGSTRLDSNGRDAVVVSKVVAAFIAFASDEGSGKGAKTMHTGNCHLTAH